MLPILKRDLKSFFENYLTYVLLGILGFLAALSFLLILNEYMAIMQTAYGDKVDPISYIILGFFINLNFILMFFVPALCVNTFGGQKSILDLFKTLGVSNWKLTLAKFLSTFGVLIFSLLSLSIFFIILYFSGIKESVFIFSGILGLLLNIALYVSIGVFSSALFLSSNVLGLVFHFSMILFFNLIHNFLYTIDNIVFYKIIDFVSISKHQLNIFRGFIGLEDIVYYLLLIFLFLFLTTKKLKIRTLN